MDVQIFISQAVQKSLFSPFKPLNEYFNLLVQWFIKQSPNIFYQVINFSNKIMRTEDYRSNTARSFRKQDSYNNTLKSNSNREQVLDPEYYQFNNSKQSKKQKNQQSFITLVQATSVSISDQIQKLAQSSSYSKAQMYGYSIEKLKSQLRQQKKAGLAYVWACYNSLNWESVSLASLNQYVEGFPTQEDIVQEIRIQNSQIRLDKLDKTLSFSLIDNEYKIQNKENMLNRFANRTYQKSLTKMTFDIQSFQFNGLIRQIQSNQYLVGIRTDKSIYVISPLNSVKRFDVCSRDIKVHESRLFFIDSEGTIGSILLQNVYVPKLNQVDLQGLTIVERICDQDEFLINAQKCMIIAKLKLNNQQSKIQFQTFLRRQAKFEFPINLEIEQDEQVIYRNAVSSGKYIHLIIFTGWNGKIDKLHRVKFLIV